MIYSFLVHTLEETTLAWLPVVDFVARVFACRTVATCPDTVVADFLMT